MMAMMDELIQAVAREANLSPSQAALAVGGMLRFCAARLPSPLLGELQSRLRLPPMPAPAPAEAPPVPDDGA
jgi:hypothetical protein